MEDSIKDKTTPANLRPKRNNTITVINLTSGSKTRLEKTAGAISLLAAKTEKRRLDKAVMGIRIAKDFKTIERFSALKNEEIKSENKKKTRKSIIDKVKTTLNAVLITTFAFPFSPLPL